MKLTPVVTMTGNAHLFSSLIVAGSVLFASAATATTYNQTVSLEDTTLVDNDKISVSDNQALVAMMGSPNLQLGEGKIEIIQSTSLDNQNIDTVFLDNQGNHDFGNGSSIKVEQTAEVNPFIIITGVNLGEQTKLHANALELNITSTVVTTGIYASSNSYIDLGSDSKIHLDISGSSGSGIQLDSHSQLVANGLDVHVKSARTGYGLQISRAQHIDLGSGSKIHVESEDRYAGSAGILFSDNNTEFEATNLMIEGVNADGINISGSNSIDLGSHSTINLTSQGTGIVVAGDDVDITADHLTITTEGNNGYGVYLVKGNYTIDLGSNSVIKTTGDNAAGIHISRLSDGIVNANGLTIHTQGANADALMLMAGEANIGSGSLLIAENGFAAIAKWDAQATITDSQLISGGYAAALAQGDGAIITLNNVHAISDGQGPQSNTLWAYSGGVINADTVRVDALQNAVGVFASGSGQVNLNGVVAVNAADNTAMLAEDLGSTITTNGHMTLFGAVIARNNGLADLTMTEDSFWRGAASQSDDGELNVSMDRSTWYVTDNSILNTLNLTGDSTVYFDQPMANTELNISQLSGNGLFVMRSDIVTQSGDLLNVTGVSAGQHKVQVINNGSTATDGTETVTIIKTADGVADFNLTNEVELGGYLYDIRQSGNNWELYSSGAVPTISNPAQASANILNAGYLMNYAETQTLLQRMADLRQSQDNADIWVRTYHGNFNSFNQAGLSDFDMTYHGFQLGADWVNNNADGKIYHGLFAGLTDSDQHYEAGTGKVKSKSVGIYLSYAGMSGAYLDAVVKYQRHNNQLHVIDSANQQVNGHGSSNGVAVSVEGGQRLHFSEATSGFYIEPQVQVSYAWQDSATINNSNGLRVDLDSYSSVLGRTGVNIGYEAGKAANTPVNIYFKNSWQHEFMNNANYRLNGSVEHNSFNGSGWVSGIGASAQLNKQHIVYVDMEKTTGKKFDHAQINLGYRLGF